MSSISTHRNIKVQFTFELINNNGPDILLYYNGLYRQTIPSLLIFEYNLLVIYFYLSDIWNAAFLLEVSRNTVDSVT